MTLFDFIAVLILLVSAVVGFVRGATREVMTVLAFILAVLISILSLRFTGPIFRKAINPDWLGTALAILVVFAVAYILVRLFGAKLTQGLQQTEVLGTLDRVVGVGFGLVRALVLLGVFNLVFSVATPAERTPGWIRNAALYPLSSFAAKALLALAPQGSAVAGKVAPALEKAVKEGAKDRPSEISPSALSPEPSSSDSVQKRKP